MEKSCSKSLGTKDVLEENAGKESEALQDRRREKKDLGRQSQKDFLGLDPSSYCCFKLIV